MNREILFKAKRIDNGEWVEGFFFKYEGKCYITNTSETYISVIYTEESVTDFNLRAYEVNPETVCQYTGLTDKNGKRIWENDIVGFLDASQYDNGYSEHYCIGQVIWDEETISFQVTERLSCESYEALDGDCEVIGNIFDNPELLGAGTE